MKWKYYKKKFRYNPRRAMLILFLFLFLSGLSVGYAFLTQTLEIAGTSQMVGATWDIHFENIQVKSGSVTPTTAATIVTPTSITFGVTLENPGDFYEFNVDVVNDGTFDAMIESFSFLPVLTSTQQEYLEYTVNYYDNAPLAVYQKLDAGTQETLKVRFGYIDGLDASLYPYVDQELTIQVEIVYVQADENAIDVPHAVSFATDSWDTIIRTIRSGVPNPYHVGDTKTIELGNSLGTHTLRIANMSTPSVCSTTGFSQTACGFVIEFADIILKQYVLSVHSNVGGWPNCYARTYLNDINSSTSIINSLPVALRDIIIDTTVVSGHGSRSGETNFTSTDKLYFLSTHEVYIDIDGNTSNGLDYYDTAYNNTRQLDYYANLGITLGAFTSDINNPYDGNYSGAIKKYNGSDSTWWFRSASFQDEMKYYYVRVQGYAGPVNSDASNGYSPAFRIG